MAHKNNDDSIALDCALNNNRHLNRIDAIDDGGDSILVEVYDDDAQLLPRCDIFRAGVRLDKESAKELRDWLTKWIDRH